MLLIRHVQKLGETITFDFIIHPLGAYLTPIYDFKYLVSIDSGSYVFILSIVMSHIRNIQEKIEDNPSKPVYIQTVWGVGYRFNKNML